MFNLPLDHVLRFITVFIRVASLIAVLPFLGSRNIPVRTKVGFAFLISLIILPFVNFTGVVFPEGAIAFSLLLVGEILIGLIIGYAARLFFMAVQMAGYMIGFQIGFGIVNVIDPQTNTQVSIIAQFENIIAMLFFLATNAHFIFLRAIADSFILIPPFGLVLSDSVMNITVHLFSDIFALSIRIGAPVLAALIFTHVALGLVARTVPQINVFIVGFPLQIGIGLFMLGVTFSFFTITLNNVFGQMNDTIYLLLRAM